MINLIRFINVLHNFGRVNEIILFFLTIFILLLYLTFIYIYIFNILCQEISDTKNHPLCFIIFQYCLRIVNRNSIYDLKRL